MKKVDSAYAKIRDAQTVKKGAVDKASGEKAEEDGEEEDPHGAELDNGMEEEKVFLRQQQKKDYGGKHYHEMMPLAHGSTLPTPGQYDPFLSLCPVFGIIPKKYFFAQITGKEKMPWRICHVF
ncbi:MAG: hypothetical protein VB045_04070 [Synergistaceae bacterium]|nr:hypothetical protein [Synergistaceae bacterium]